MKLRNLLSMTCGVALLSLSFMGAVYADKPTYKSMLEEDGIREKILASPYAENYSPTFISIEEYLNKYGKENVIRGLNEAEIKNNINVLKKGTKTQLKNALENISDEPNDVFKSMIDGNFLGMTITGISDYPPDDVRLVFRLKRNTNNDVSQNSSNALNDWSDESSSYNVYSILDLSEDKPYLEAYEPLAGSYMYMYSFAFEDNYLCESNVTFNNSSLYCGSQANNMYTYVAAKSTKKTLDFGLMANPKADNRNSGMYICYNNGVKEDFFVQPYPKIENKTTSTNPMLLPNKTVKIRLSIGYEEAELYMEMDGECIFYDILKSNIVPTLISGDPENHPLTFIQAISCVGLPDGTNTNLKSGSYFKNVEMHDAYLYPYSGAIKPFTVYGEHTYYTLVAKPDTAGFTYGDNWEKMSINYKQ